ncbi:hypothetical protein [Streptomyces anthocyanicus]|uniref:hypothetical protein n=1 Tax=Streptomyces anthocyanicus TaxID=68174 RepID=UPI0038007E0D
MQFRSTGSRLSTAILAVLAVTALGAGTLASAPAALAAAPGAASGPASVTGFAALPAFPKDVEVTGVGAHGFFGYSFTPDGERELRWWPYGGGAPTLIDYPEDGGWATSGGDVVALGDDNWVVQMRSLTLRNMADPSAPGVDIDLGALGGNYVAVLGPTSVLAQLTKDDGTAELHIVTKDGATTTSRKVAGLPADATDFTGSVVRGGAVLVGYETGPADARSGGRALDRPVGRDGVGDVRLGRLGVRLHSPHVLRHPGGLARLEVRHRTVRHVRRPCDGPGEADRPGRPRRRVVHRAGRRLAGVRHPVGARPGRLPDQR